MAIKTNQSRISCEADINAGLKYLVRKDEVLANAIRALNAAQIPVPLRLREPGFSGLAEIVISQQVSKASASAINARFQQYISPAAPQIYLSAPEETRIAIGLSRPKQQAFDCICEALLNKNLVLEGIEILPVEQSIRHMCQVKGIGPWTAEVYLLFCAGHADIFPAGDLALQEAQRVLYGKKSRPTELQLRKFAKKWAPWRGVAARLLWAYYSLIKDGRDPVP